MVTSPLKAILDELKETDLMSRLVSSLNLMQISPCDSFVFPVPGGLRIQIELDKDEKRLLIGTTVGNLQSGSYRLKIFKEALKANGMSPPHYGVLGFSRKTGDLILFDYLDMRELTGSKVAEFLVPFLDKAKIWHDAIEGGNLPDIAPQTASRPQDKGLFGLRL